MVANMVADKKRRKNLAHVELDKVANIGVDMLADMEVDMVADININMEILFGERVGHGGWLIGPKLFQPKAYLACASSKLYEF